MHIGLALVVQWLYNVATYIGSFEEIIEYRGSFYALSVAYKLQGFILPSRTAFKFAMYRIKVGTELAAFRINDDIWWSTCFSTLAHFVSLSAVWDGFMLQKDKNVAKLHVKNMNATALNKGDVKSKNNCGFGLRERYGC